MPEIREGFREIVSGWTLVHNVEALGNRIEAAAAWVADNGGLEACSEDERKTIGMMVDTQIAWGIERGDFEPYIHADDEL